MTAVSAANVKVLRERTGLGMMACKKALLEAGGDIDKAIENLRKASSIKAAKKSGRTAAEGVVVVKLADDQHSGVLLEVNTETDFASRDENFLAFVKTALTEAFVGQQQEVAVLMEGELEEARKQLVQKMGENVTVRRLAWLTAQHGVIGCYVHTNDRIAVLVALKGGDATLAREVAMHVAAVNPHVVHAGAMPQDVLDKEKAIIKAQPDMAGKPEAIVDKMIVGRINKFLKENSLLDQPFVKNPELTVGNLVKQAGAEVVSFVRFEVGEGIEVANVDFADEVAAQLEAAQSSS